MILLILAALAAEAPPAERTLLRHPDGGFTITRPIDSDPPSIAEATDGLIEEDREAEKRDAESDYEEAFEDAVEMSRMAPY